MANQSGTTKHDKENAACYKKVSKIILSKTLQSDGLDNTRIISDQLAENIHNIKKEDGKNILIFGSLNASHPLLNEDLIDEFLLFINPILIGNGTPLFKNVQDLTQLKLIETKIFESGVIGLHYDKITR
ncbi:dihydrofolate reductase family protein [Candidatus Gracilibacteria bacterium]|nr:dihydrofolate reductase family protein [Candidatus Gracilibacteria bacterium]